jgi:hypothetical protein
MQLPRVKHWLQGAPAAAWHWDSGFRACLTNDRSAYTGCPGANDINRAGSKWCGVCFAMLGGRLTNDTRRRPLARFCTSWREEGKKAAGNMEFRRGTVAGENHIRSAFPRPRQRAPALSACVQGRRLRLRVHCGVGGPRNDTARHVAGGESLRKGPQDRSCASRMATGHWPSQVWLGWKTDRRAVRSTRNTKSQQARGALWLARALNRRTPCSQSPEGGETWSWWWLPPPRPSSRTGWSHGPRVGRTLTLTSRGSSPTSNAGWRRGCCGMHLSVQGGWFRCVPLTLM